MTPATYTKADLELVVRAGNWLEVQNASEDERALAATLAAIEAERREAQWAAFETFLRYASPSGRIEREDWPADPAEQVRIAESLILLGWHVLPPKEEARR
jgi:hypothetical protein